MLCDVHALEEYHAILVEGHVPGRQRHSLYRGAFSVGLKHMIQVAQHNLQMLGLQSEVVLQLLELV